MSSICSVLTRASLWPSTFASHHRWVLYQPEATCDPSLSQVSPVLVRGHMRPSAVTGKFCIGQRSHGTSSYHRSVLYWLEVTCDPQLSQVCSVLARGHMRPPAVTGEFCIGWRSHAISSCHRSVLFGHFKRYVIVSARDLSILFSNIADTIQLSFFRTQ